MEASWAKTLFNSFSSQVFNCAPVTLPVLIKLSTGSISKMYPLVIGIFPVLSGVVFGGQNLNPLDKTTSTSFTCHLIASKTMVSIGFSITK